MRMDKKELYVQPIVIVFSIQSEGVVCQSSDLVISDWTEDPGFPIVF